MIVALGVVCLYKAFTTVFLGEPNIVVLCDSLLGWIFMSDQYN